MKCACSRPSFGGNCPFGIHVKYPKHWKILSFYEHFRYLFTTDSFYEHFGEAKRFMELWVTKSHDKMSQIPMIKCRAISVANKNTPNSSYFWCQSSQGISVLSHTNASGVRISRSLVALQWPTFFFPLQTHHGRRIHEQQTTVQYKRFINIIHIQYSPSLYPIPL